MSGDHDPPRRPASRRCFQFGLRALLTFILLAAVLVAWQRERLAQWVESLWPNPPPPVVRNAGLGWSQVVSPETLEREIHRSMDAAAPQMVSKAKWNTGHRKVRSLYSTMAVCFGVIAEYDGPTSYEQEAVALRDALARSAANSKVNDDRAMFEARSLLNELNQLQRGGGAHGGAMQLEVGVILRDCAEGWRISGVRLPPEVGVLRGLPGSLTLNFEDEQSIRDFFVAKSP